jgi:hypothetical protein
MVGLLRGLSILSAVETISLSALIVNLVTVHNGAVSAILGPVHGAMYLCVAAIALFGRAGRPHSDRRVDTRTEWPLDLPERRPRTTRNLLSHFEGVEAPRASTKRQSWGWTSAGTATQSAPRISGERQPRRRARS